jgi:hypothetical protein
LLNGQLVAGVSRPSKAIWKAFRGAFQRMVHLQAHQREIDTFERGLLVGEVPACSDGFADAGVDALDRVGRADYPPDLRVEGQERHELCPGFVPPKALRRPDPLRRPPRAPDTVRGLDRRLPHLPPTRSLVTTTTRPHDLAKHYQPTITTGGSLVPSGAMTAYLSLTLRKSTSWTHHSPRTGSVAVTAPSVGDSSLR